MHIEPSCFNLFLFFFALAGALYVSRELFVPPGARQVVVALGAVCAVAAAIVALVC